MNIIFYIPPDQIIPTCLRLRVIDEDGQIYDIYYYKEADRFTYTFEFFNNQFTDENGLFLQNTMDRVMDEIVDLLIWQSEDHGARWVKSDQEVTDFDEFMTIYQITFRKRDGG